MISRADAAKIMAEIFEECKMLREAGQKEYAHDEDNALANFERVAAQVGATREQVLMTYLLKHIDGINAHIKGHRSQRESVYGRIHDAIVYLTLLSAMFIDNDPRKEELWDGDVI